MIPGGKVVEMTVDYSIAVSKAAVSNILIQNTVLPGDSPDFDIAVSKLANSSIIICPGLVQIFLDFI